MAAATGLTVSMPGLKHIPAGQELEIVFADADLHFFDEAGQSISLSTGAQTR